MTAQTAAPTHPDSDWDAVRRVEAWAGELRVNLVRLAAIIIFYGRHLAEYGMAAPDAPVRGAYHLAVTIAVLAWAFEAVLLHVWLARRRYGPGVKYLAVLWDSVLVTLLCVIAGGPQTPLALLYFAVIASAPVRLSLRLVYVATAAAMAGYLFLLGFYAWYKVGFDRYYATPELRIPRSHEIIWLLALLVCGMMAGQVVRQVRRMILRQAAVSPLPLTEEAT